MRLIVLLLPVLFFSLTGCSKTEEGRLKEERLSQALEQEERIWDQTAFTVQQAIAPADPKVKAFASRMAEFFPGEYNFGQVCAIWYYMKEHWRYASDPKGWDYFAPAYESIGSSLSGDCDDFAILLASSIEAIGGSARVILAYGKKDAHAYCEVFVSRDPGHVQGLLDELVLIDAYKNILGDYPSKLKEGEYLIHFHRDDQGWWLNLDYSAPYPGGPFFRALLEVAVYPDGRWETVKN